MSFVDKESLKQLIINIKNTFVKNGDSVTVGKSTNNADNFINAESTNEEIIAAWNNNKFALAKGLGNISIGYDNLSLGDKGSLATGRQTKALNSYAFSNGLLTEATGWASVATGDRAKAFGDSSRAGGYFSEATGSYSTAEGYAVKAKGACSHVVNRENTAEGDNSFACNRFNNAKGIDSFAGGNNSTAGGAVSFVHGSNIQESGNNNAGFGANHTIKSFFSATFGRRNKIGGNTYQGLVTGYENELNIDGSASNNTFVGGAGCRVSKANNSFVFGNYLKLMRQAWGATAFGSYNDDTSTASFVIGNGRSDTNRSNAFEVYGNGLVKTPNAIDPTDPYHLTTKKYVDSRINKDKFKIVDILPTTDIDKSLIYLVPASESDGKSYYDEYIYVSHDLPGAENIYGWELLGTTQLEVDLSDYYTKSEVNTLTNDFTTYHELQALELDLDNQLSECVKNTDYATANKAGVVRARAEYGIRINEDNNNGILVINSANKTDINDKSDYFKPIVPAYLEHAIKVGLTTNTIELTEEEKTAARNWFGAVGITEYATGSKAGTIKVSPDYGLDVNRSTGFAYLIEATNEDIDSRTNIRKPIVPANLDYAVKKALADNKLADTAYAWTEEEKAAARELLGAIGNTDYATQNEAGLVRAYAAYGTLVSTTNGIMSCDSKSYNEYQNGSTAMFVGKGTLENVIAGKGLIGNTDYATDTVGGVVKVHNNNGLYMQSSGDIAVYRARDNDIISRTTDSGKYRPICPANLDLAVKVGVTANTITLTDEEKAAAQQWLGVNLTDYVKNTDYADYGVYGLLKVDSSTDGLEFSSNGALRISPASTNNINGKSGRRPITPVNIDLAVKVGITTNTIELTEEEKASARSWVGAVGNKDYGSQLVAGLCKGSATFGSYIGNEGVIVIQSANETDIDNKTSAYRPIVPSNLDYAVKSVTYDKSEIDSKLGDIETALDELHNYAQALISGGVS